MIKTEKEEGKKNAARDFRESRAVIVCSEPPERERKTAIYRVERKRNSATPFKKFSTDRVWGSYCPTTPSRSLNRETVFIAWNTHKMYLFYCVLLMRLF